jgi:flagellar hook-associated protein 3 FlgL
MAMRVTFNTTFTNGLADINATAARLAEWQRQVSSQKRVQKPSDDPSAAANVVGEQTEMAALDQFKETTDSVDSRLRVVDTLLSDIISSLTSAQTTAAAGRTTVTTAQQRQALAQQIRGIRDNVLQDFNGQYRGTFLFSGTATLTAPFSKNNAGVVQPYAGTSDVQQLDIDRNRSVEVTVDGGAVAGNLFQAFDTIATAIETGNMTQIDAGMTDLNAAFDRLTTAQSRVGLALGDLDAHRLRLNTARNAADSRRSSLEDANLAESISRMQQADTAYRAALSAFSQTGRLSLMDYIR